MNRLKPLRKLQKSLCLDTMFGDAPFAERFARARRAGFHCVEFGDWSELDITQVQELLQKNDLVLTAISGAKNHSLADPGQREDFLEFLSQSIAIAKTFSCRNIVVPCWGDATRMASVTRTLVDAAHKAERAGMMLLVKPSVAEEDRPRGLPSAGDAVRAVDSVALRLLYEARQGDVRRGTVLDALRRYRDFVGYVQVGDDSEGMRCVGCKESFGRLRRVLTDDLGYEGVVGFRLSTVGREEECLDEIRDF